VAVPSRGPNGDLARQWARRRTFILLNVWAQVILALLLVILVNAIAGMTPQTRAWCLDLTGTGRHRISSKTRNILRNLKGPLRIYVVAGDGLARLASDRRVRVPVMERLQDTLGLYEAESRRVNVRFLDYDRDKQAILDLQLALNDTVPANSIIVRSGTRHETVPFDGLILEPEEPATLGARAQVAFDIEGRVTEAISRVTEEHRAVVYVLSGYDGFGVTEDDPYVLREFAQSLRRENYDLRVLRRGTFQEVPKDCDVLLVVAPAREFAAGEIEAIRRYLDAGGGLFCLMRPRIYSRANADLAALWNSFGCAALDDRLVYEWHETTTPGQRRAEPQVLATHYGSHPITDDLRTMRVRADFAVPLMTLHEAAAFQTSLPGPRPARNENVVPLIFSSDQSWGEDNFREPKKDPSDLPGPCAIALAAEGPKGDATGMRAPRMVLSGSCAMVLDEVLKNPDCFANRIFALNAMGWLARRDYKLGIPPQRSDIRPVRLTIRTERVVFYVTAVLMPLTAALGGAFTWWRRRSG